MSVENLRSNDAVNKAEARGLEILRPKPNELFIDIDSKEDDNQYYKMKEIITRSSMEEFIIINDTRILPSPSGGKFNKHIILDTNVDFSQNLLERLLLQACLGSDRDKEFFSYIRVLMNDPHPTLLFQKKEAKRTSTARPFGRRG